MLQNVMTIGDEGPRRLLAAILLRACADAHKGDAGALEFIESDDSAAMADALHLRQWPPSRDMLCDFTGMKERRRILRAEERKPSVKTTGGRIGQLDFSDDRTHTTDNRMRSGRPSVTST